MIYISVLKITEDKRYEVLSIFVKTSENVLPHLVLLLKKNTPDSTRSILLYDVNNML